MDRTTLLSTIATDICTGCGITAVTMDSVLDDIANNCVMPEDLNGAGSLAGALDPLWISAWEPFHGASKKDFGFQIILKVSAE